jgi:four helix bundle protein
MGKGFKNLLVWQKARDLAIDVYQVTDHSSLKRDFGLRDQMRRSAVSVPSNIAEGDERDTDKDAIRFFYIAKGSLAELRTQLEIAYRIEYLDDKVFKKYKEKAIAYK